jgi:hypothetical protein
VIGGIVWGRARPRWRRAATIPAWNIGFRTSLASHPGECRYRSDIRIRFVDEFDARKLPITPEKLV